MKDFRKLFGPKTLKNPIIDEYNSRFESSKLPSIHKPSNSTAKTTNNFQMSNVILEGNQIAYKKRSSSSNPINIERFKRK